MVACGHKPTLIALSLGIFIDYIQFMLVADLRYIEK